MIPELDYDRAWRGLASDPRGLLGSYPWNSTLAGPDIDLYAMGGSTHTVEADHSRQPKVATDDRDALKAAVVAAGGTLDRGKGWLLSMDRAGHLRHRRAVPPRPRRDRTAYLEARQAEHEREWALAIHLCACGCGEAIGPGHYDRPRSFAPGHSSRSTRARLVARQRAAAVECTVEEA